MLSADFAQVLASMSVSQKISALSAVYSRLTICTRELFLPDRTKGKERTVFMMLHGINELHHTLANWLVNYSTDESKAFPVETLSKQLEQIATEFHVDSMLEWSIEAVLRKY